MDFLRYILKILLCSVAATALGQSRGPVQYNTSDLSLSPSNVLSSNILAGANVTIDKGDKGRLTINAASSGALTINTNQVAVGTETNLTFLPTEFLDPRATNVSGTNLIALHVIGVQPTNANLTAFGTLETNAWIARNDGVGTNTSIYGWMVSDGEQTNRNILVLEGTSGATGLIVNTNQLVVSGLFGGVGINTNTPFQDLHVVGGVLIDSGDGTNFFQISGNQIDFQGGSKNVIRFPAEFEMEIQAPTIRTIGTNYVNGGLHVTNQNVAGVPMTVNGLASHNTNLLEVLSNAVPVFAVNSNGNLSLLRTVPYTWPAAQGAASTVLQNDGSGNLSWSVAASGQTVTNMLMHAGPTNGTVNPLILKAGSNVTITTNDNTNLVITASAATGALTINTNHVSVGTETNLTFLPTTYLDPMATNVSGTNILALHVTGLQPVDANLTDWSTIATNFLHTGQTLWVDAVSGDDTTAQPGRFDKPFATLGHAKTNASAGDLIYVRSGTYTNHTILANGVRIHCEMGATIWNTDPATPLVWDSSGSSGAITSSITGFGKLIGGAGLNAALLQITNPLSVVSIECESADHLTGGAYATLYQRNGALHFWAHDSLRSESYDAFWLDGAPVRSHIRARRFLALDNAVELAAAAAKWGDVIVEGESAESTGVDDEIEGRLIQMHDNCIVRVGSVRTTHPTQVLVSGSGSSTNGGLCEIGAIYSPPNGTVSAIDLPGIFSAGTLRLRNSTIYGPTNLAPVTVGGSGSTLILEDCRIVAGRWATNAIWATNAQTVQCKGVVSANTNLHANITVAHGVLVVDGQQTIMANGPRVLSGLAQFLDVTTSGSLTTTGSVNVIAQLRITPPAVETINTDDYVVDDSLRSYIRLQSDSAVATDRTFYMGGNAVAGTIITLEWVGANAAEITDDSIHGSGPGFTRLNGTWTPAQHDTLTLIFDGIDWHELSRNAPPGSGTTTGSAGDVQYTDGSGNHDSEAAFNWNEGDNQLSINPGILYIDGPILSGPATVTQLRSNSLVVDGWAKFNGTVTNQGLTMAQSYDGGGPLTNRAAVYVLQTETNAAQINLGTTNAGNFWRLQAPDSLTNDFIVIPPTNHPTAGQVLAVRSYSGNTVSLTYSNDATGGGSGQFYDFNANQFETNTATPVVVWIKDGALVTNVQARTLTVIDAQTNSHLTASKLVLTGTSKELVSSTLGESDIVAVGDTLSGDISATFESDGDTPTTIANNVVSDAKLRDSAAVSVIGRSANSIGDPADIAAAANGQYLKRTNDAVLFGVIADADLPSTIARDSELPPAGITVTTNHVGVGGETNLAFLAGENVTINATNVSGTNIVHISASIAGGAGDVVGPASATDNAMVRYDGTTGKLIKNSVIELRDGGVFFGPTIRTDSTNTALGTNTLTAMTAGIRNTAIGHSALSAITNHTDNTAIGHQAGRLVTGTGHTIVGSQAGTAFDSGGVGNVVVGRQAAGSVSHTNTTESVFIGYRTGFNAQRTQVGVFIGAYSGENGMSNTYATAVGQYSLHWATNTLYNTCIGSESGEYIFSGTHNTLVGGLSGMSKTDTDAAHSLSTGTLNLLGGYWAWTGTNSTSRAVGLGADSKTTSDSVVVGYRAGGANGSNPNSMRGERNILIGADANGQATATNQIVIAYKETAIGDNDVVIGNTNSFFNSRGGTNTSRSVVTSNLTVKGYREIVPQVLTSDTPTQVLDVARFSSFYCTNLMTNITLVLSNVLQNTELDFWITGATNAGANYTVTFSPVGAALAVGYNSVTNGTTHATVTNNQYYGAYIRWWPNTVQTNGEFLHSFYRAR